MYAKALQQAVEDYGSEFDPGFVTKVQGCVEKECGRIAIETFHLDTTVEEFVKLFNSHSKKYLGDVELMPGMSGSLIKRFQQTGILIWPDWSQLHVFLETPGSQCDMSVYSDECLTSTGGF